MTLNAWVENDRIRDVTDGDPAERFHPSVAANYDTRVPDDTKPGATLVDGSWVNPTPPPAPAPGPARPRTLTPIQFKLLLTSQERIAIKQSTDAVVQDFLEIINDPQLQSVELGDTFTTDALNYLEAQGLIASGRADEILAS